MKSLESSYGSKVVDNKTKIENKLLQKVNKKITKYIKDIKQALNKTFFELEL